MSIKQNPRLEREAVGRASKEMPAELTETSAGLLTVAETAAILRLSVSAIRSWILSKRIPYIKLGKAVRIRRGDVDTLVAASLVPAKADSHRSEAA